MLSEHEDRLNGRPSHVTILGIEVRNTKMRQRYTTVRKGLTTYVLIETAPAPWASCDTALEKIIKSVRFE